MHRQCAVVAAVGGAMSDPLAAAIIGGPSRPAQGIVAEISTERPSRVTSVHVGGQTLECLDQSSTMHMVGDAVSIAWAGDGIPRVTGTTAPRPASGTVESVTSTGGASWGVVACDDGTRVQTVFIGTVQTGTSVHLAWLPQGPTAWPSPAGDLDILPPDGGISAPAPATDSASASLPNVVPTTADPVSDVTVRAIQSGTVAGGEWQRRARSDELEQGAMIPDDQPASGVWLYGSALDFLSGRSIWSASIDVTRSDPGMPSIGVEITLQCHDGRTGGGPAPIPVGDPWPTSVQLRPGEQATITIPPDRLAPLTAGTAHGIGLGSGGRWCRLAGVATTIDSGRLHIRSAG